MVKQVVSSFLAALAALVLVAGSAATSAQPVALSTGFANVFTTDGSDCGSGSGNYCFGSAWGISDLKATAAGNTYTLQPNFNNYAAADAGTDPGAKAYWMAGGVGPLGNKIFEGSLFNEVVVSAKSLSGDFSGTIDANTIDAGYTVEAYVQVIGPPDFLPKTADVLTITPATTSFALSVDPSAFPGDFLQMGFRVRGLNANPADEVALGSVVATVTQAQQTLIPPPEGVSIPALPLWGLLALAGLVGLMGLRRKA